LGVLIGDELCAEAVKQSVIVKAISAVARWRKATRARGAGQFLVLAWFKLFS
jgi:hypothetical protein